MHVKDVWDLQMKEDWHSYHSLQIKCDLSTKAFIIGKKNFETRTTWFCPNSKYFALCSLQRVIGVTRLDILPAHILYEMTPG